MLPKTRVFQFAQKTAYTALAQLRMYANVKLDMEVQHVIYRVLTASMEEIAKTFVNVKITPPAIRSMETATVQEATLACVAKTNVLMVRMV